MSASVATWLPLILATVALACFIAALFWPTNVSSSAGVADESGPSEPVPSAGLGRTTPTQQ